MIFDDCEGPLRRLKWKREFLLGTLTLPHCCALGPFYIHGKYCQSLNCGGVHCWTTSCMWSRIRACNRLSSAESRAASGERMPWGNLASPLRWRRRRLAVVVAVQCAAPPVDCCCVRRCSTNVRRCTELCARRLCGSWARYKIGTAPLRGRVREGRAKREDEGGNIILVLINFFFRNFWTLIANIYIIQRGKHISSEVKK